MSSEKVLKNPCPPGCVPRSEVGLRLRQTHYILGKDNPDKISEYRYEYNPKKVDLTDHSLNQNRVNFLRNSHFSLGDTKTNYLTSSQEQSESIPTKILNTDGNLNDNKTRLQGSHFIFGNDNNDYVTKYTSEYYNKNPMLNDENKKIYELISNKLKETHVSPISDEINYETETQDKYRKPNISEVLKNKSNQTINTADLQKSHLKFGRNEVPWVSTSRYFLTPKKNISKNNRYISNEVLQKSHFSLSQDKDGRNFKTESMDSFVEYPLNLSKNTIDVDLKNNLRREHFSLGTEDNPNDRISSNRMDFQDPKLNKNYMPRLFKSIVDPQKYRRSNWTISNGDERDFFKSTYNHMMTPKKPEVYKKIEVNTFKSSIKIGGKSNPNDFQSEYKNKYGNKLRMNLDSDNSEYKKLMETISNIRRSHLNFGDNKNDYGTTNNDSYKYDADLAKAGRGKLNKDLKNNLMSSHYKLGMGNDMEKMTSNRRDYRSYPGYVSNKIVDHDNSSNIFKGNRNIFEGESIYMSDYTEKPLPNPDESIPDFL